jgi:hypothetical protein
VIKYGKLPDCGVAVRPTQAYLIQSPAHHTVILLREFAEMSVPEDLQPDATWALEPRLDSPANQDTKLSLVWPPPQEVVSVGHSIRVQNNYESPISLHRHDELLFPDQRNYFFISYAYLAS